MHPDRAFAWTDEAALRAFVVRRGLAHVFAATAAGPMVVHVPLTADAGGVRFHVARRNRAADHLDGAPALASIVAADAYVSPGWYASADQVPTWNYRAVEIEGTLRRRDEAALVEQLDAVSAIHEAAFPCPWTREKMTPGRFAAMLPALFCFELADPVWRGTAKASQNKPARDRHGVVAGLLAAGRADAAAEVAP